VDVYSVPFLLFPTREKVDLLPSRGPNCNCCVHKSAAMIPILSQLQLIHIIRPCFLKDHFNSISYLWLGFRFFNFLCILHVSKLRVHLQGDGFINRYGIVCCTVRACRWKSVFYRLPENEPSGLKHVEYIKN
jgi:hypothetical protein